MPAANDQIRGALTKADIALAAQIGEDKSKPVEDRLTELFEGLPDPLLSAAEVKTLVGLRESVPKVEGHLEDLVKAGKLEDSSDTQRPLDKPGLRLFRSAAVATSRLKMLALQAELVVGTTVYQLCCDGRLIRSLARIERLDAVAGKGQQRQEIKAHVARIAAGLKAGTPVPNPVLLVLLESTTQVLEYGEEADVPDAWTVIRPLERFTEVTTPGPGGTEAQRTRLVEIDFPFRKAAFDDEKSILLVDGQQRTAALSMVPLDDLPVCELTVNALVGDEDAAQEVFQVANDTVKISTDLSLVLAAIRNTVPAGKSEDKLKAEACRILALQDKQSPFFGRAKVPGAPTQNRYIAFLSLFEVVSTFRGEVLTDKTVTAKDLAEVVKRAFSLASEQWPSAWKAPPGDSRLTHGAGLRATAYVLAKLVSAEAVASGKAALKETATWAKLKNRFAPLGARIAWTLEEANSGTKTAQRNYLEHIREAQNTKQDIERLSHFLWAEWQEADAEGSS